MIAAYLRAGVHADPFAVLHRDTAEKCAARSRDLTL